MSSVGESLNRYSPLRSNLLLGIEGAQSKSSFNLASANRRLQISLALFYRSCEYFEEQKSAPAVDRPRYLQAGDAIYQIALPWLVLGVTALSAALLGPIAERVPHSGYIHVHRIGSGPVRHSGIEPPRHDAFGNRPPCALNFAITGPQE